MVRLTSAKTPGKGLHLIPSIEEILQLTGKDTSSWTDAIALGREERF
jgi:hypothetical protein